MKRRMTITGYRVKYLYAFVNIAKCRKTLMISLHQSALVYALLVRQYGRKKLQDQCKIQEKPDGVSLFLFVCFKTLTQKLPDIFTPNLIRLRLLVTNEYMFSSFCIKVATFTGRGHAKYGQNVFVTS